MATSERGGMPRLDFTRRANPIDEPGDVVASAHAASRRQAREVEAGRGAHDRDEQWRVDTQAKVRRLSLVASVTVAAAVAVTVVSAGVAAGSARTASELRDQTVPMLTATRDMQRGEALTPADLAVQEVPVKFAPADYLSEGDAAELGLGSEPKVLLAPVSANNPLARSDLSDAGSLSDVALNLREGYVGLSLQLDTASGVSSLLRVGDRVDVMAALEDRTAGVVAQGVRVVALGTELSGAPADGYETVTLELSPADASMVAAVTSPRLVLRSALDQPEG